MDAIGKKKTYFNIKIYSYNFRPKMDDNTEVYKLSSVQLLAKNIRLIRHILLL